MRNGVFNNDQQVFIIFAQFFPSQNSQFVEFCVKHYLNPSVFRVLKGP